MVFILLPTKFFLPKFHDSAGIVTKLKTIHRFHVITVLFCYFLQCNYLKNLACVSDILPFHHTLMFWYLKLAIATKQCDAQSAEHQV
jgi:hypothetical protein